MVFGIMNSTPPSWGTIQNMTNTSSYPEFAGVVNQDIYGGWFYFIILWVIFFVLYIKLNDYQNQPLINLMYSSGIIAVIALFLRAIEFTRGGVVYGLLTDYQLWIFPIIAIILAGINWTIKDRY